MHKKEADKLKSTISNRGSGGRKIKKTKRRSRRK